MNVGVRALLNWAKATIAHKENDEADVDLEYFPNGELLLKLVYILKKEASPCLSICVEDRFKIITDFVEGDCRFKASNGTPILWEDIKDGNNLVIEISKVLLLFVYHDIMNDHCTLRNIDSETESQIAILTENYVLESEGSVSLKPELVTYLSKRYLKVNHCDFNKVPTSVSSVSTTPVSSVSSYDDDNESPLFVRSQKVKFVDLHSVASSSVSCSPIQSIMNTPKFQLRKLQRQLIEEREYRDGLEKELSQKLEILAQRESQMNRMQYFLDKLKKDQGVSEQIAKEQFDELENKHQQLQLSFSDVLKHNKDLKGDSALMERKVDQLTEENGALSAKMRSVCAKLATSQAEVTRLMETQSSNEEEWRTTTSQLQSELNDARAKKGDLVEQIEILKGRISCLEDQMSRSTSQEEGDNMWISVEKVMLERKIGALTDELENTTNSLHKIEVELLSKTQQLKEREKAISDLQKEMTEAREALQEEISTLKLNLEKAEQEKCAQTKRLQLQLETCAEEMEKLKEIKQQKEELLFQTEEKIKDLVAKLSTANDLLVHKDEEVHRLTEKIDSLVVMHQQAKDETRAKDELYSQLLVEKSQEEEVLKSNMQLLKDQVNGLQSSLKEAEESLKMEKDLLNKTQQEKSEQIDMLRHDIVVCKQTIETLEDEIQSKDNQVMEIKNENLSLSERLQKEIDDLNSQISGLCDSLTEAKQQAQTLQTELTKQEEESTHQKELLQQQLSFSEEMIRKLREDINSKTDQLSLLERQSLEKSEVLKTEMNSLQQQVACLKSHLTKAQNDLCLKENDFALKLQEIETLQTQVSQFEDELKALRGSLQTKEEEFCQLKRETSTEMDQLKAENLRESQALENEIAILRSQVQSVNESLNNATQQLQIKEEILARKEIEISCEKDTTRNLKTTLEEEINALKQQIYAKEEHIITLKNESDSQSNLHREEKQTLQKQLDDMTVSLSKAEEQVQTQVQILSEQELKGSQEQQRLQQKLTDSQGIIKKLEGEIHDQEHLQQQLSFSEDVVRNLKEEIKTKTDQLHLLESQNLEKSEVLTNEISDLQQQLACLKSHLTKAKEDLRFKENDFALKLQEAETLQTQVSQFENELNTLRANLQTKEEEFCQLKRDLSTEMDQLKAENLKQSQALENEIQSLHSQVQSVNESLNNATQELQVKEEELAKKETEISCEKEVTQNLKTTFEEEINALKQQINAKEEHIVALKNESDGQLNLHQEEKQSLQEQLDDMAISLNKAEERLQAQLQMLTEQEVKSAQEQELLQVKLADSQGLIKKLEDEIHDKEHLQQQLSFSEELVRSLKEEIKTKTDQFNLLESQSLEKSEILKTEINDLQEQLACLKSDFKKAQEDLHLKENDFATKLQEAETLQTKVSQFEGELKTLRANLQTKEEEFCQLKRETSTEIDHLKAENLKQSQALENEIQSLRSQVQSVNESLNNATQELQIKEEELAKKKTEISCEKEVTQNLKTTFEEEINALKQQIHAKEEHIMILKNESDTQSNLHQEEKQNLQKQLDDMTVSLSKAEERVQAQLQMMSEQELKSAQEQEQLQQRLQNSEGIIKKLEDEIHDKEHQMAELRTQGLEQSKVLMEQNECIQRQLESLTTSLKVAEEKIQSKESLLTLQQQENKVKQQELCDLQVQMEQVEKQMLSFKHENKQLHTDVSEKHALLEKTQQQCQVVEMELAAIKIKMAENNEKVLKLREDAVTQAELIHKAKDEIQNKDKMLNELKVQSSQENYTLQQCVKSLKDQIEDCSQKLVAKETELLKIQLESSQEINDLNLKLVSLNTELNQKNESHCQVLKTNKEMLDSAKKERDNLIKEKGTLESRILAVEKQLELTLNENQRLAQAKQALERENSIAQQLQSKLLQDLQMLKQDQENLLNEKEKMEDMEKVKKDLLEQLSTKSTAVEHYKAQMEKAVSHYNSKKQLLQESEEQVAKLKQALDIKEAEAKNAAMENKMQQMELEKIQSNEKLLFNKIASLEAQLIFADKALREQNKIQPHDRPSKSVPSNLDVPSQQYQHTKVRAQSMSSDSLDQSSADDSLDNTRRLCAPEESSTPLVRSSERLAAKRQGLQAESLETLYFTPINTRQRSEESVKKSSASSVKRRRTTQVINITMTKKTPGRHEADDSFYSLTSARSHPNLSSAHKAPPISTELFATPAKVTGSEADQLIGLPGYRRSTIHSQATSTFCVGSENEPEGGPEDWMRIAEIQARNKACLPHLKSSYPLEFDTVRNSALMFTDEELRTGDPVETMRRATVMPGQLQDSLASHRLSYMVGQGGAAANTRSRLSLMPGQEIPKAVSSTVRSPKGKRAPSTMTLHPTSPEKKVRASCFPRPLTPKNKNVTVPTIPHIKTALSPAERRQSMMFTIDNTPRKDLLKKGLGKLRGSRKSPGKTLKSPAQPSNRRGQENIPVKTGRPAVGGAGRLGSQKSPMTSKGQRKSPRASTRAAKSPGLTASARKMMSRMKM